MNEIDYNKSLTESVQSMSSQEVLDQYGITEYTVGDIIRDFETAIAFKEEQARIFKILDAADRSDIWKIFNKKIPNYVQTPVNNLVTIIKEATKASIMPTSYAGQYVPLTMEAKQLTDAAGKFFKMKWIGAKMDKVNSNAADYAFLHGTSGVLFGWNQNIIDSSDVTSQFNPTVKSQIQAKAYHPSNIFPDPSATCVEEMKFIFFAERKSKAFLKTIARFQNALSMIENVNDGMGNLDPKYIPDKAKQSGNDIVTFSTCYKRVLRKTIDPVTGMEKLSPSVDVIYLAGRDILDISPNIQPNCIPFVPLYDEETPNNFWGISKCYKVLSLQLALAQLDSTEATAYFKNQNPAEFINVMSGLNVAEYQKKRNNPDAAFSVNCDPKLVQGFADRPDLPKDLDTFRSYLITAIQSVSGVDSAYLGRDYGSIQTTGGIQQAVDRSTMRDSNRIKNIDDFIRKELELITQFYMIHGQAEQFYSSNSTMPASQDTAGKEVSFNPAQLIGREDIEIVVHNAAPRSGASYEEAAMKLMELQMKYNPAANGYPDFLTPEELLNYINMPHDQKYVLLDRMKAQMTNMKVEEYMAVLTAVGTLTQGGMPPEQALQEVAAQMESTVYGQIPAANPNPGQPMTK